MERIQWDDLPGSLKEAISARTGSIAAGHAVADGLNSPLGAIVETGNGRVFVKGIPLSNRRHSMLNREIAAAPLVTDLSPPLLWHFEEAGWKVLGFEYLQGRSAGYLPGSEDLELVVPLMRRLGTVTVPEGYGPVKYADDRYKSYAARPDHTELFAGAALIHTDWMPGNVMIADGRAWLVDWAWATAGAAWIDPACWVLRLIAHGHKEAEAETWGRRLRSYADADAGHVDAFALVNVNMWDDLAAESQSPWITDMQQASHRWAAYRGLAV